MSQNVPEVVRILGALQREVEHLTIDSAQKKPIMRLGLITTLYFRNGHLPEVRRRIDECFARFYYAFRPLLKWQFYKHERKLSPSGFTACRRQVLELAAEQSLLWSIASAHSTQVAPYRLFVMSGAQMQSDLDRSCLKMILPWTFLLQGGATKLYEDWVKYLCNQVHAEHGYSGLSCIFSDDDHQHRPLEYRLAQRYAGLMVDPVPHIESLRLVEHIKGVSWYTVLGNRFVKQLGGSDRLRGKLSSSSDVMFHAYDGGLMIRAGLLPELGHPAHPLPSAYVAVNKLIKPVRLQETGCLHPGLASGKGFDEQSSAHWYARFDEKPKPAVEAGVPCPQTGYWFSNATVRSRRLFTQGEIMPTFAHLKAQRVRWFWVEEQ